jgi:arylformamidase
MKIIDISMELNEKTIVWVQDEQPKLIPIARIPEAPINFTWLDFGAHAGTHIDAPYYLFNEKWKSDEVPFEILIGNCQVIDLTEVDDTINVEDLKKHNITSDKILLKTKNSFDPMKKYNPNHVALSIESAKYLRNLNIKLIGYDYQSFERNGEVNIHRIFMEDNIICLDNLRLADTQERNYKLICLPIKVTGIDAAPSRVILMEE